MIIKLNPYIPLITPAGFADAFAMQYQYDDRYAMFYCFMENQIVCVFESTEVRRIKNVSLYGGTNDITKLFTPEQINKWAWVKEI